MGHLMSDLKTTQGYMKYDKHYLANAKAVTGGYLPNCMGGFRALP